MQRITIALAAVIFSCTTLAAPAAAPAELTVIATADFHGAVDPEEARLSGGRSISIGGPALLSSYLRALKEKAAGPVVYVDAGDLFQGSMESNLFEGKPIMRLYNYLAPAAAALGNHEFDYGPVGPKSVPRSPGDDGQGALKARISEANFPFLAVNVRDDSGQIPGWLKASVIKETGGIRVGVVGAANEGTPTSTNALNLKGLSFIDPYEPIRAEAERLRRDENVNAIVVVIHDGGGCDDNDPSKQDDLSSCKVKDIFELVKRFPEGLIDVVVAGHTHMGVAKRIGRTAIIQPFAHGQYVAWATVPLGAGADKPSVAGLSPVCSQVVATARGPSCDPYVVKNSAAAIEAATFLGAPISPDTAVDDLLRPEVEQVKAMKEAPLGVAASADIVRSYGKESALGNMMADVSQQMLPGLDLGLTNGGGLRANFNAGPLTYGAVFNVFPFDNQLAVVSLTGAQITKLVELGLDGSRGVFSWSAGLKLAVEGCQVTQATLGGAALEPMKVYKVATSDFLAGGGSGFGQLKVPRDAITIYWDQQYILRDLTAQVLERWKKDLGPADFFDPAHPRMQVSGTCGKPR